MTYLVPLDIANRALDHVGQDPIDTTLGFNELSKKARLCSRLYDKLRRAELRRNVWQFATKRTALRPISEHTMSLVPTLWSSVTTYFIGSIVSDSSGILWVSVIPDNLDNEPGVSFSCWEAYFGPLMVYPYDSTEAYFAGELVYLAAGDGTYVVYRSLQSANEDDPSVPTDWDATIVYNIDTIVNYLGTLYMSLINLNLNQTPSATSPPAWDATVTYLAGQDVRGSDGVVYQSIAGGNIGHDPILDAGVHWTNTGVLAAWDSQFTGGSGSLKWLEISAALAPPGIVYPIGSGPSSQSQTRNIYRLPANFLREAPQSPKAGSTSYLGAAWGLAYPDWEYESNFIVSSEVNVILYRFVADYIDVRTMDPMFCEGLAARIAVEICEPLTQSTEKLNGIETIYKTFMGEARTVNGILTGSVEPPIDDYLACRA